MQKGYPAGDIFLTFSAEKDYSKKYIFLQKHEGTIGSSGFIELEKNGTILGSHPCRRVILQNKILNFSCVHFPSAPQIINGPPLNSYISLNNGPILTILGSFERFFQALQLGGGLAGV